MAPSLLLAVAPLVLGVPHLAADVRHLLVRRASPRWWLVASAAFALALLALRVLAEAHPGAASLAFEHAIAASWVLAGAAGGACLGAPRDLLPGPRRWTARGWAAVGAAALLATFAIAAPRLWQLILLHGHNLVAILLWVVLFRRGWRLALVPVALVLGGAALLASGALLDSPSGTASSPSPACTFSLRRIGWRPACRTRAPSPWRPASPSCSRSITPSGWWPSPPVIARATGAAPGAPASAT